MARARYKRFVVVTDTHGDMLDETAAAAFWEFMDFWKPQIRIHSGDAFDLRALREGASEEEKADGTTADVEAGLDFLKRLKPEVVTLGNHDWRLWRAAANHRNGVIRSHCSLLVDQIHDALPRSTFLPYDRRMGVHRIGHLKVIHGYHSGVYAARQAAQVYGAVLMGHVHTITGFPIAGLERRMGRTIGCLCKLDPDYARAKANTLSWAHGWAYGLVFPSGEYQVWQAEQINGAWWFPSEIKEVRSAG